MIHINENYLKLRSGYLFPEIAKRVQAFAAKNPQAKIIRLGIGDVTQALPPAVVTAAKNAFDEMSLEKTFRGYGPEQGYDFLREAIVENEFKPRGAAVQADEVFVSDGSKCDTGNIQEIFSENCKIAVPDPVYPVYVDTNIMAGRIANLVYLEGTAQNGFLPELPKVKVDVIYLCFPNNPTGVVASKDELKKWVDFARKNKALILFDAAYEAFITDDKIPHSIFEIEGARDCAIEFRSYSKTAGFTGTRCAFTIVPKTLMGEGPDGAPVSLHALWSRRQTTKFNGVSYPIQKAALACYSPEGKKQIKATIDYYLNNAKIILSGLKKIGLETHGGLQAPYIWFKTPDSMNSWDFFDKLLNDCHVVGTPGSGFGVCGEGYMRLSAFGSKENVQEAVERIVKKFS